MLSREELPTGLVELIAKRWREPDEYGGPGFQRAASAQTDAGPGGVNEFVASCKPEKKAAKPWGSRSEGEERPSSVAARGWSSRWTRTAGTGCGPQFRASADEPQASAAAGAAGSARAGPRPEGGAEGLTRGKSRRPRRGRTEGAMPDFL